MYSFEPSESLHVCLLTIGLVVSEGHVVTDDGIGILASLPLTSLSLRGCDKVTEAGLARLWKLKLTWLDLEDCNGVTNNTLETLKDMPLTGLVLRGCRKVTDTGLDCLIDLPQLTSLDLRGCSGLSDEGLERLQWAISVSRPQATCLVLRFYGGEHTSILICVCNFWAV